MCENKVNNEQNRSSLERWTKNYSSGVTIASTKKFRKVVVASGASQAITGDPGTSASSPGPTTDFVDSGPGQTSTTFHTTSYNFDVV